MCKAKHNGKYKREASRFTDDRVYRRRKDPTLVLMDVAKSGPMYAALCRLVSTKTSARGRQALNNWSWLAKHAYQIMCPVTGLPFDLSNTKLNGAPHPLHPSLDRIDSTKGYTPDNVRLVSFWANIAKSTMPEDMFRMMVSSAAANMTRH